MHSCGPGSPTVDTCPLISVSHSQYIPYLDIFGKRQKKSQMYHCLKVYLHFQLKSSCLSSSWASNFTSSREVHVTDTTLASICLTPPPSSCISIAGGKSGSQWTLSVSHCPSLSVAPLFLPLTKLEVWRNYNRWMMMMTECLILHNPDLVLDLLSIRCDPLVG